MPLSADTGRRDRVGCPGRPGTTSRSESRRERPVRVEDWDMHRLRRGFGPGLGLLVVLGAAAGTWLAAGPGARTLGRLMDDNVLTSAVNGVELGAIATVLVFLRPGNRVGWLLMYAGAANAVTILGEGWALASYQLDLPGRVLMAWLGSWAWVTTLILGGTVLPAIYPTGRAAGRFARWVVRIGWTASLVAGAAVAGLNAPFRSAVPGHRLGPNPVTDGRFQTPLLVVAGAAAVCGVVLVVVTLVWTLRRLHAAGSPEREQLAWLMLSVIPSIVVGFVAPPPVMFAVNLLTALALLVGIVRVQLFDIKLVLRSGLVYGLLLAGAVAAYFVVVDAITLVVPGGLAAHGFAAAAVALLLVPAYRWLTGAVGRLVYGDRDDPVRALGRVGVGLAESPTGAELPAIVEAVAQAVRSPHVAVWSEEGSLLASAGSAPGHPSHEVPLRHGSRDLGRLEVSWRTPRDRLSGADRSLVAALASPVAVAVRAAQLARQVGDSRARVVALRESERRRLRNDLHDGLGPSLSGVALGIEAALRTGDDERLREILGVVHDEVTGLVAEVRHLIDDLGDATPSPGGLVVALRERACSMGALTGIETSVEAGRLPELSPEAEAALHRIATEAITNVVRHADASRVWVRVDADDASVSLEIIDDGVGVGSAPPGVGRASMRERATSLGGTFEAVERSGGGTRVRVVLPAAGAVHA